MIWNPVSSRTIFCAYVLFYVFSRLLSQKLGKDWLLVWPSLLVPLEMEVPQLLVIYLCTHVHWYGELPQVLVAITYILRIDSSRKQCTESLVFPGLVWCKIVERWVDLVASCSSCCYLLAFQLGLKFPLSGELLGPKSAGRNLILCGRNNCRWGETETTYSTVSITISPSLKQANKTKQNTPPPPPAPNIIILLELNYPG